MADQVIAWIRNVATLNDLDLNDEVNLIHQSSVNAFARAIGKVRRPDTETRVFRTGELEEHPHAMTINLLMSVGEYTIVPSVLRFLSVRYPMMLVLTWMQQQERKF